MTRVFVAAAAAACLAALPGLAHAQLYVTGVSAAFPDPNNAVPGFNKVPNAGIPTWSSGLALVVLTHGQSYEYCVSLASGTAAGTATVSYKIVRGATVIQKKTIVPASKFTVGSDGVWYLCAGYTVLPDSPGPAKLIGAVTYYPQGGGAAQKSSLGVNLILQ